nr:hypothetical protein [Actinomycetota bacterium]
MTDMGGDLPPDEAFAVSVQPGETRTLAWTFSRVGTFEYACHVAVHSCTEIGPTMPAP